MVNITLFELHLEDASFSTALPFGGPDDADTESDPETEAETTESGGSALPKVLAGVGLLVVLVGVAVLVKRLRSGEEPEVEIETADDYQGSDRPVGVSVD